MITLTGQSPSPGEKLVSPNTLIELSILEDETIVDPNSITVLISGVEAIKNSIFSQAYNGPSSSLTYADNTYTIIIEPVLPLSLGGVYEVKVQCKEKLEDIEIQQGINPKFFNFNYAFKTVPKEPILLDSSPKNKDILTTPQILSLEFEDIVEGVDPSSITVLINGLKYIDNGVIVTNYNGGFSEVVTSGTTVTARVDPLEALKNGKYKLSFKASDLLGNTLSSFIDFEVNKKEEVLPLTFPQIEFLGFFQGIQKVTDIGDGSTLELRWNKPIKRTYQNQAYVLVYQSDYRLKVFDSPTYISTSDVLESKVPGLKTGDTLSFGARALEFPIGILDPTGMEIVSPDFYRIPSSVEVVEAVNPGSLKIKVNSTTGYPNAGIILIGKEAIRYTSIDRTNNIFNIPSNGRALLGSKPVPYVVGDSVKLFLECTDRNTVIIAGTPTHQGDEKIDRFIKGIGVVVTDYNDVDKESFEGFDYCSWRDEQPINTLTGKRDCGSYLGGEYNGFRGFNLYDRMLGREEVLLQTTGEPVVLLKRIWDGVTCSCMNARKVSPKIRSCQDCYGTGYEGGYLQYMYPRRNDRRILVSFDESPENVKYGDKDNLSQNFDPHIWTLATPTIRDRDLIVRFDFTNDIEFIYEVLNVSREKIFNRKFGRQKVSLKRMDKTDIIYTYPLDLQKINIDK
jgi:hypothetical protein